MIRWDIVFFANALVAALYSVSDLPPVAVGIARGLLFIFMTLYLVALLGNRRQRSRD